MLLNSRQKEKVLNWFATKHLNTNCPCCGSDKWSVGDIIGATVHTSKGISLGGESIPMLQIVCSTCAYVNLFAAVPMGLFEEGG